MSVLPWALIALVLPILGGGFLQIGGARPDIYLAFMVAAVGNRHPTLVLAPTFLGLCGIRYLAGPPEARGECIGLLGICLALLAAGALVPLRSARVALGVYLPAAFGGLALFTAIWEKGTGGRAALPSAGAIALSLILTALYAAAFSQLMPYQETGR